MTKQRKANRPVRPERGAPEPHQEHRAADRPDLLADAVGEELVDGDATVDDGALADGDAGEEVAGHGGVDALAGGGFVEEAVDDVEL